MSEPNPEITQFLRRFTFIEACVLIVVGFGLFFLPHVFRPLWPWQIAPFNARFLGAIYIGAMVPVALMYFSGRWSPTRVVLRAIFAFTFIVLVVSVYHYRMFDFASPYVWIWFALYIALPASGAYHIWLYRSIPANNLTPTSTAWRFTLRFTGLLLAVYGTGLILVPETFSTLFPWKLDAFHSQLYAATFITGSVIMLSVAKAATKAEFIAAGYTEAIFSGLSIAGLVIVDLSVKKIDWLATDTVAWVSLLAMLTIFGFVMIFAGKRNFPE